MCLTIIIIIGPILESTNNYEICLVTIVKFICQREGQLIKFHTVAVGHPLILIIFSQIYWTSIRLFNIQNDNTKRCKTNTIPATINNYAKSINSLCKLYFQFGEMLFIIIHKTVHITFHQYWRFHSIRVLCFCPTVWKQISIKSLLIMYGIPSFLTALYGNFLP